MSDVTNSASTSIVQRDGSICLTEHLLKDHSNLNSPVLICFHGSGTVNHFETWASLIQSLNEQRHPVVFFDRGPKNPSPCEHVQVLWDYLTMRNLAGPYVLIAHSYGGSFAKHFLHAHRHSVGGIVLAEAGKANVERRVETELYRRGRRDRTPLCVIRANSMVRQWQALLSEANANVSEGETSHRYHESQEKLDPREDMLRRRDELDEELEKGQLKLSNHSRYVYLPDCGHNVIRERQDVVVQEVQWVVEQYRIANSTPPKSWLDRVTRLFSNKW